MNKRSFVYPFARALHGLSKSMRIVFFVALGVFVISGYLVILEIVKAHSYIEPVRGGTLTEGIIGIPRYINPLLATTDADLGITRLVYAGLMQKIDFDTYQPNLASSCTADTAGKQYTCTLNAKAFFHDRKKITSHDIAFTVDRIQKGYGTQSLMLAWRGVTVQTPDEHTVVFLLEQPFAGFWDMLTVGILPEHLWSNLTKEQFSTSELNTNPVGTGSFKLSSISYERKSGQQFPKLFHLTAFKKAIHRPYLKHIVLAPFASEDEMQDALKGNDINAAIYESSEDIAPFKNTNGYTVVSRPVTKPFALFINYANLPVFRSADVRLAFEKILANIQAQNTNQAFGFAIQSISDIANPKPVSELKTYSREEIAASMQKAGYVWDDTLKEFVTKKDKKSIEIPLFTTQSKDLQDLVNYLKAAMGSYGIVITPQFVDAATLEQRYIRTRSFGALLFGEIVNKSTDWFAYLHSSQIDYPGLNITRLADTTVDKLVNQLLTEQDPVKRTAIITAIDKRKTDQVLPIIFLYEPAFHYVVKKSFTITQPATLQSSSDHFNFADTWYRYSVRTLNIFAKKQ